MDRPSSKAAKGKTQEIKVALLGNPNTGKSTLINALTGSQLRVGNWPGTTVERLEAKGDGRVYVDLPGTYSLFATTPEEVIAREAILEDPPDLLLVVLDAGNLGRSLSLALEATELGLPMVVALNLMDEAEAKGYSLNPKALEESLGVRVVPLVATRKLGLAELKRALEDPRLPKASLPYPKPIEEALRAIEAHLHGPSRRAKALLLLAGEDLRVPEQAKAEAERARATLLDLGLDPYLEIMEARFQKAQDLFQKALRAHSPKATLTERWDRLVLHPLLGPILFLLGMFLTFRFTFLFSRPWVDFLGLIQEVAAGWIAGLGLPSLLSSFLSEALVAGIGTILAFTPVLFALYLALGFLETSGLLARFAFLADRIMQAIGLPGRAFIPLVLGFGCNVPAIHAAQSLESFADRAKTVLAIPFMACSARLTVFTLFAAIFFPKEGAFVVFGLYLLGLGVGLFTAFLVGRITRAKASLGVMELPPYRLPPMGILWNLAKARTMDFVRGAGGPILLAVLLIWALLHLPPGPLAQSLYARLSQALAPLFAPLGFEDWRLVGALIPGFLAKEVVVGTLGLSFLGAEPTSALGFGEGLRSLLLGLLEALKGTFLALPSLFGLSSPPSESAPLLGLTAALQATLTSQGALAYLVFVLLYTPCVATLAAIRKALGPAYAAYSVVYQLSVAYLLSFLAFHL